MTQKLNDLTTYMKQHHLDLVYIDHPQSVSYFTDFESNPHERIVALIALQDNFFLFTPEMEKREALKVSKVNDIVTYSDKENPWEIMRQEVKLRKDTIKKIGIEENTLTVDRYKALKYFESSIEFFDMTQYVQNAQLIKNSEDISRMKAAGKITDKALEIGFKSLKEGITEQEVVAEIEYQLKKLGIKEMSFPTMVLFGDHAGSPHGTPGDRKLKNGELVLFDLGVVKNGVTSDVTRTVTFKEISEKDRSIYEVVYEAQQQAQKAVKPGITAEELDTIARTVIEEAGYGDYFTHRLGHGLGKSVHEYPSLTKGNDLVIQEGMCFSVEPGIYIPGKIGIRIEDCVYVTEDGCLPFTTTPKELLQI